MDDSPSQRRPLGAKVEKIPLRASMPVIGGVVAHARRRTRLCFGVAFDPTMGVKNLTPLPWGSHKIENGLGRVDLRHSSMPKDSAADVFEASVIMKDFGQPAAEHRARQMMDAMHAVVARDPPQGRRQVVMRGARVSPRAGSSIWAALVKCEF